MKTLVQETFENEFNEARYKELVLNLFNHFDFSKEHTLKHQFNDAERQALNDFTYFGAYEDAEKKSLDVLTVQLKSSSKVERARSLQRNLIGKYLKANLKDSALVAFYSKDNPDWRLSFVKMDYRLDEMGVKVEIGTPPKRYSFLVGKTEPSHTAQKQLLPLLDDRKTPTLDEIEKSFSIEKVTKEFYTEIAKKFTELVGGERKIGSKKIVAAVQLKYPKPSDTLRKEFAVRLIGRLMFCWFLKKKKSEGGVPLIPKVLLSSDAIMQYPDYYHSLLEPLFFQVLNTPIEKRNKNVKHRFWNDVPFLNGGLFEPHLYDYYEVYYEVYYESGLSKYINTLKVLDSWFLDLFKIFEIYNFTIDESTSIDIDISVDPEMLGRIFENLLAEINPETGETARKSTGSYYTPRPIVEYMVDESLKQYLKTQLTTSKNVIPTKVGIQTSARHSELSEESLDSRLHGNDDIGNKLSRLLSYGDWEIDLRETEKDSIIDALDRAKIIDPACGSGAFPMGILHKMLLILQKIDPESKQWLSKKLTRIDNEILRKELEKKLKTENWDYVHKLGIIQNSIYGVDIQPIAVEISKLRFFLSLIVDEKIDDDKPNRGVVPLPNLEFKFVAANSLIGLPLTSSLSQMELFEARDYINKLKELRDTYFTSYGEEKNRIEQEFQQIQNKMFEYASKEMVTHKKTLETQTLKLSEWNPFSDEASSWFNPEWMFGIHASYPLEKGNNSNIPTLEKGGEGGFDIVIANPPYVRQESIKDIKPQLAKEFGSFYCGTADIYTYFYKKGIDLLKAGGHLCFIAPNKFMRAGYGKNTRKLLATEVRPKVVIDFCDLPIFDATTYPSIILVEKKSFVGARSPRPQMETAQRQGGETPPLQMEFLAATFTDADQLERLEETLSDIGFSMSVSALKEKGWNLERPEVLALMEKLRKIGTPLGEYVKGRFYRGILTGLNEAFVIDAATRDRLISEDPQSEVLTKPWLRGRDIKKWKAEWAGLYLISIPSSANRHWPWSDEKTEAKARKIFAQAYPSIHKHLSQWEDKLIKRDDQGKFWWELRSCVYYKEFEQPKIIYPNITKTNIFAFDTTGILTNQKCFIIPTNDLCLLAIFNSELAMQWFVSTLPLLRGGFFEPSAIFMQQFPLVVASDKQRAPIIERVNKILANPDSPDVPCLEAELNQMVYDLYSLTPREIEIVEGRG